MKSTGTIEGGDVFGMNLMKGLQMRAVFRHCQVVAVHMIRPTTLRDPMLIFGLLKITIVGMAGTGTCITIRQRSTATIIIISSALAFVV